MSTLQKIVFAAIATLILLVGATFVIRSMGPASMPTRGVTILPQPLPLPDFQLADQDGEPFTRASLLNRPSLLFFGFTNCPDICPATLQQLALARRRLAAQGADTDSLPDIILISVDPERDTSEILHEYTAHFGPGVRGASGDLDELRKLTSALGIYFAKDFTAGQDYTVNHSAAVLFINRDAEFQAVFNAPLDIDALVANLPRLMNTR